MTASRTAAPLLAVLLLASGCAPGVTSGPARPSDASGAPTSSSPPSPRSAIVPRVDHHQHLVGPGAVLPPPPDLPDVALPPELDRVLRERNRIMGTEEVDTLFGEDARIVVVGEEGEPWARGLGAVRGVVAAYPREARFVANAFAVGDSVAQVSGVVRAGTPVRTRRNFTLGLRKDRGGAWRIASEHAMAIPPRTFEVPLTAERLIRDLDEAGIERAVVLSVAYFFGSPVRTWPGDEYANVRAENDWVAAQVARYPDRLVGFCGVSPLKEYAVREVRRCGRELGMRGIKMHFRSSRVDILNPEHLAKVRDVFRTANEEGLAIVVHAEPGGSAYGPAHAEAFLSQLLPAAPDVPVQIAHLWGGNQYRPEVLAFYADAVSRGDPRTRNLYFDLTEVAGGADESPEALREIAERLRQIGLGRILYGSDAPTTPEGMPPVQRWARLRLLLPLTDDEMRVIAGNVAPYVR